MCVRLVVIHPGVDSGFQACYHRRYLNGLALEWQARCVMDVVLLTTILDLAPPRLGVRCIDACYRVLPGKYLPAIAYSPHSSRRDSSNSGVVMVVIFHRRFLILRRWTLNPPGSHAKTRTWAGYRIYRIHLMILNKLSAVQ